VPYTIEIHQDNLAPGTKIHIDALGEMENGKKYTVDDETAARFEVMQGVPLSEALFAGITVTKSEAEKKPAAAKKPEGDEK
jgi:hypothetical protein